MSTLTSSVLELQTLPSACPDGFYTKAANASSVHAPTSPCHADVPVDTLESRYLSKSRAIIVIAQLCLVSILCSLASGILLIALPKIATDLSIDTTTLQWPVIIFTLTAGCFVLLAGSIADVIGGRLVNLTGVFFLGTFVLAAGFPKTGDQLIAFRALGGVALSLFLPTSVSLISQNIESGTLRNSGFSFLGVGQVIGYGFGLVLGGVLVDTIGWRAGFYICGASMLALFVIGLWALPHDRTQQNHVQVSAMKRLQTEIDWVGLTLSTTSLAMLAYVLAQLSSATSSIHKGYIIALLTISILLVPTCALWFGYQERRGKPALMPNSLWKRIPFTTMCIVIMFVFAQLQTMEFLSSLFFQQIQGLSALQASLRLLPNPIVAAGLNFTTGLVVHRIPANWLVIGTAIVGAAAPLLMALIDTEWSYWKAAFLVQILIPLASDVLFTVALLLISEVFPEKDQALAGAVFNTVTQFGQSLGLAIVGVISSAVTQAAEDDGSVVHGSVSALMKGYRAAYWTAFAWMIVVCALGSLGLGKVGKVGLKRD